MRKPDHRDARRRRGERRRGLRRQKLNAIGWASHRQNRGLRRRAGSGDRRCNVTDGCQFGAQRRNLAEFLTDLVRRRHRRPRHGLHFERLSRRHGQVHAPCVLPGAAATWLAAGFLVPATMVPAGCLRASRRNCSQACSSSSTFL